MTKEEIENRKEALKATISVPDILIRYGVQIKRGRCKSICHQGKNYTAKVSDELYYCFKCNQSMDIFDLVMHFENCSFWTAFEILGGTEKPSFTATVKANKAKRERKARIVREQKKKADLKRIQDYITVYRKLITESEPFSDLWCYCQNKIQYQLYLLEYYTEKR